MVEVLLFPSGRSGRAGDCSGGPCCHAPSDAAILRASTGLFNVLRRPEENKERKRWIIDGRDSGMPAGTDALACYPEAYM